MQMQRISKQAARYTSRGGVEHCSLCRHFVRARGGSCKRVEGTISPAGWCKLFSREMAASVFQPRVTGGGGGPPPTLDLSFMTPGTLSPLITFTRASTGTYFDSSGVLQTAAVNAPRWDYNPATLQLRGLLLEEARTNLLLNSATLGTQSVTTAAQSYALSFYGTGTITKSGTATGALVGTGATQRVSQTFTPTAGSLTLTVTGSVTNAQLEGGQFPTSWILTTGASATRAVDVAAMTGANFSGWFNQSEGTFSTDTLHAVTPVNGFNRALEVSDGGTANTFNATFDHASSRLTVAATVATVSTQVVAAGYPAPGVVTKFSSSYGPDVTICTNIGAGPSAPVSTTPGAIATLTQINLGNRPDGTRALFGYLRRVRYWRTALSDAEMQSVTA